MRESAASGPHIKQVESAIAAGKKDEAAEALKVAQPELARGVARGVLHRNTASRKLSRLSKRVARSPDTGW
jgi:small subunit ribosomal protein S20